MLVGLAACDEDQDDERSAACQLQEANQECPECYDGDMTCTYGDVSVTEGSCGGCQARSALYQALCAAGNDDTKAEIESGMDCQDVGGTESG
jgi:hypothetical protein